MKLVLMSVAALAGCAQIQAATNTRTSPPTLTQLAEGCRYEDAVDDAGQSIGGLVQTVCPWPADHGPDATIERIDLAAATHAARLAVLVEREYVFVRVPTQRQGQWALWAYYAVGPEDPSFSALMSAAQVRHFLASEMLGPAAYAEWRARAVAWKERRSYDACRAFLVDVEAAAKDPARADACDRLIAAVERRQEHDRLAASQAEMAAIERERASIDRHRAAGEDADRISRAFRAIGPSPAALPIYQLPRQTTTNCQTYGRLTNCTTQ